MILRHLLQIFFFKYFFGVPHLATFILFLFIGYVIASSIAYIRGSQPLVLAYPQIRIVSPLCTRKSKLYPLPIPPKSKILPK